LTEDLRAITEKKNRHAKRIYSAKISQILFIKKVKNSKIVTNKNNKRLRQVT